MKLCVLIAAAGKSSRMGYHKALMPIEGRPAALYLSEQIDKSAIQKALITLPAELFLDHRLREGLRHRRVEPRLNLHPKLGYAGSVSSIIDELSEFSGLIATPIDAPFASRALFVILRNLIHFFPKKSIIAPCFGIALGHPVYFSWHFFPILAGAHRLGGLCGLMKAHKKFVRRFHFPSARILANLNSPADLLTWHHVHADVKGKAHI